MRARVRWGLRAGSLCFDGLGLHARSDVGLGSSKGDVGSSMALLCALGAAHEALRAYSCARRYGAPPRLPRGASQPRRAQDRQPLGLRCGLMF